MANPEWEPYVDGFVKGDVGIFPGFGGAWVVWNKVDGEWSQSEPLTYAATSGRTYDRLRSPPYEFWERTKEETILEAKRLAEQWIIDHG